MLGTVVYSHGSKGIAYVKPDDGGADVFVHHSNVDPGHLPLGLGDRVSFDRRPDRRGGIKAIDVTRTDLMPTAPPRLRSCGCRVAQGELCYHSKQRNRERQQRLDVQRGSAASRGYDADWQRESRAFLAEPGNKRCRCGAPAVLVAHRISIRKALHLRMDRSNWMPSCQACNLRQNIREEGGFGKQPAGGGQQLSKNRF